MSVLLLILGLVLFVLLVVVHEFGHFIMARRHGVAVEEFGLGFPPRARVLTKRKGTVYSLNWLPLGGFVRLKGEHDDDKTPHSYGAATLGTKVKILLAGVFMNLLAAFVILMVLAWVGMPQLITKDSSGQAQFTVAKDTKVIKNEVLVGEVESNSPASHAGIKTSDQLLAITPEQGSAIQIKSSETLPNITKSFAGQTVTILVKRNGSDQSLVANIRTSAVVNANNDKKACAQDGNDCIGYLGISPTDYTLQRSTWSAPIVAGGLIGQFTALTFQGLGHAIGGLLRGNTAQASAQVSGPVGIFVLLQDGSLLGYQFILIIIAVISLTLAIMNTLPIPALDGGKLFVTLLFRLMRKKLTETIENRLYGTGFALLMVLIILITIVDVKRYF